MNGFVKGLLVFVGLAIALILLFIFLTSKMSGVNPADYFDRINPIEENNISVYIHSDL